LTTGNDSGAAALAAMLDTLVELVPDACLAMSADGTILAANADACHLYRYRRQDLVGAEAAALCAPGSPGFETQTCDETARAFDSVHVRADCTRVPVRVRLRSSELLGSPVLVATVTDDCEPRNGEAGRIESAAFDAALDAIIVHDLDGNLIHFNSAAAEASGMTPEEFACIEPWGWVPPAGRAGVPARLEALLERGSLIFEGWGLRADGTTYENEVHARVLSLAERTIVVSVVRDISERRRIEEAIHTLAYHDVLTGLPNRNLLSKRAEQAMAEATRHGDLLGLAFVDLDEFKPINDDIGHAAGDAVLTAIASRLVSAVRTEDTVARFGGDEFVVMLPRLGSVGALERIGSKLSEAIRTPLEVDGRSVRVTASIGLAVFDPLEDGFSSLLSKADMAMYSAKRAGEAWRVFDTKSVLS